MNILVLYAAILLAAVTFAARLLAWRYHVRQIRRRRERRGGYLPVFDQEWVPSSQREARSNRSSAVGMGPDIQRRLVRASLSESSSPAPPPSDLGSDLVQDWTPKR